MFGQNALQHGQMSVKHGQIGPYEQNLADFLQPDTTVLQLEAQPAAQSVKSSVQAHKVAYGELATLK